MHSDQASFHFCNDFQFSLPIWINKLLPSQDEAIPDPQERMSIAINLAQHNIIHKCGGPFGACVYNADTHKIIAPGINLVLSEQWPAGHAEIIALTLARQTLEREQQHGIPLELVTSCEPCMMCMGASLWFGVKRILIAARGEDAEAIGFDEGPKPADWANAFTQRGIEVEQDILRPRAIQLFHEYNKQAGKIYNAGEL
ncbi:nucleoside deaminase [bacterium]|nr:nucleoside deaminase [bacterium]